MAQLSEESAVLSVKNYVIGYVLSLGLTIMAVLFVNSHIASQHQQLPHSLLVPVLAALAFGQFVVQMIFFLHLGHEDRPRWKQVVFWFMAVVVVILVTGSLWIMDNLNYNMMSPEETKVYMKDNEGF